MTDTEISEANKKIEATKQQPNISISNSVSKGNSKEIIHNVAQTKTTIYFNGKFDQQENNTVPFTTDSPKSCWYKFSNLYKLRAVFL